MKLLLTTCVASALDPSFMGPIGICRAQRYIKLVSSDKLPSDRADKLMSSALTRQQAIAEGSMARELARIDPDATVSVLYANPPSGQRVVLAVIHVTRGTRSESAALLTGRVESSIPSSRTYLGMSLTAYLTPDTAEIALAEFSGHARVEDPMAYVTTELLTAEAAAYVLECGANLVMIEAYRHALRRWGRGIQAFISSTSPYLIRRERALEPLCHPLFHKGVEISANVLDNPNRFDRPYFAAWPSIFSRVVDDQAVIDQGARATIQHLVACGFKDWHQLPELCLPYLIKNDDALAAAIPHLKGSDPDPRFVARSGDHDGPHRDADRDDIAPIPA